MATIDRDASLEELAAIVSQSLEEAGIRATLSGGAAVTLYANNEYLSGDLDFVTSARVDVIGKVLAPLAFGETTVADDEATTIQTPYGPLRIITPTQLVMDRIAAYAHWHDGQSLDQAIMVARHQSVDWTALSEWAAHDGLDAQIIDMLRRRVAAG